MKNAFTVDVEDYFQVQAFAKVIDPAHWDDYQPRVVANTTAMLELLAERSVIGTFFVLGWGRNATRTSCGRSRARATRSHRTA